MFNKLKSKIKNFVVDTKTKAETTLDETKEKVTKLTESADKFLSDSNNQMKIITVIVVGVGLTMIVSNVVNVFTTIYSAKHSKAPMIIQNIYPNNVGGNN